MPLLKFMLTPYQRRRLERLDRVNKYGSPMYPLNMASLAAATARDYAVSSQWPAALKYAPLDWIEIVNNDVVDLLLTLNGSGGSQYVVVASSNRQVKDTAFEFFRIENLEVATASTLGAVRITAQKAPLDADDVARREL